MTEEISDLQGGRRRGAPVLLDRAECEAAYALSGELEDAWNYFCDVQPAEHEEMVLDWFRGTTWWGQAIVDIQHGDRELT